MSFLICIAQPTFDLDDQLDLVSIFNLHVLKLFDEDRGFKLLPLCKTDGIFVWGILHENHCNVPSNKHMAFFVSDAI